MKILINTPAINLMGGVAQIYNVLELNKYDYIDYFEIMTKSSENKVSKLVRLLFKYIEFIFKINSYDIVHLNPSFLKNSFYRDAIYCFIAKLFFKKVIVFWHGWENDFEEEVKKSKFKQWILINTYGKASKTLVLGKVFKEKLENLNIKNTKFEFITSIADDTNIDTFNLANKFKLQKDKKQIDLLFLSRILKEKGVFIAIDTINKINKLYANSCILHIAGTGEDLKEVEYYVKSQKIENIIFHGFISGKEKFDLLEKTDICFFPTYYGEGLPNTILESMLYAQPIISRVNAGITDHIISQENGFIAESIEIDTFVKFVEYFLLNKSEIERMGRINNQKAIESYTANKVKEKMLIIYNQVNENG